MKGERPPFYDDLDATLDTAFALLARGTADRRSAFHTLTVATLGLDGRPRARTVVSRKVLPAERRLRFHCDLRTDKAAELAADPRVALHGYDPGAKIQLRLEGRASLHAEDAVADEAWASSREASRVCYGTAPAPGDPLEAGGAFTLPATPEEIAGGRAQFCAVLVAIETVEFLYLASEGHRRARFAWQGEGWEKRWLVP